MIIKDYEVCSPDMTSGGTSLKGYKTTTYDRLCQVLGPSEIDLITLSVLAGRMEQIAD